ncbi:CAH9 anhydrase, partial [Polypterus senegalus]
MFKKLSIALIVYIPNSFHTEQVPKDSVDCARQFIPAKSPKPPDGALPAVWRCPQDQQGVMDYVVFILSPAGYHRGRKRELQGGPETYLYTMTRKFVIGRATDFRDEEKYFLPDPEVIQDHMDWGLGILPDQDTWSSDFEHCNGKSQSPINIDTTTAKYDTRLSAIELQGYELSAEDKLTLKNNGHTLLLNLPNTMHITKGFDNVFVAAQLHFHWGTKEVPGSEHTVDGLRFPAEIHVVHYNSKYENLGEAASQPDGLAVLGAFLEIGRQENAEYNNILTSLADVSSEESDVEIDGFNIRFLLPSNLERFFRYNGSLTTPPCFQTVNWTVFNDTIKVSRKQMAALEETLKIGQSELLTKNFRAPQLLFGREVLSSFKMSSDVSPNGLNKAFLFQSSATAPPQQELLRHTQGDQIDLADNQTITLYPEGIPAN